MKIISEISCESSFCKTVVSIKFSYIVYKYIFVLFIYLFIYYLFIYLKDLFLHANKTITKILQNASLRRISYST